MCVQSQLLPWWLVIRFPAHFFFTVIQEMEYAQRLRRYHHSVFGGGYADKLLRQRLDELKVTLGKQFSQLYLAVEELGLNSSADQTGRVLDKILDPGDIGVQEYAEMMQALLDRLYDDTKRQHFFMIPPHKVLAHTEASRFFGDEVNSAFPSAQTDIEHAAKCYAFGRNTATVFHLMRVMEVGLRALGESLNDPNLDPKKNPTWESILKRCDEQLKLSLKDRSQEWRVDDQFYSDAVANLRAVKNAWRNPTMHVERNYEEDEALDVLNSVKGFMRLLATKLKQRPVTAIVSGVTK
jgi:hypothetical protein